MRIIRRAIAELVLALCVVPVLFSLAVLALSWLVDPRLNPDKSLAGRFVNACFEGLERLAGGEEKKA